VSEAVTSNVTNDTLAQALREAVDCTVGLNAWKAKFKGVLKKWEGRGVSRRAIKLAIAERGRERGDFIADQRQLMRFLAIEGTKLTPDILFDNLDMNLAAAANETHRKWLAEDSGYQAGFAGKERETNPFPPGSEWYALFDRGFLRGATVYRESLPPDQEVADTTRRPQAPGPAAKPTAKSTARAATNGETAAAASSWEDGLPSEDDGLGIPDVPPTNGKGRAAAAETAAAFPETMVPPKRKPGRPRRVAAN
jgi:hypothetical protein